MKGSSTVHRRAKLAYYLVPAFVFTSVAFSNFLHVSFGVYLKYQALIDLSYQRKIDEKFDKMVDPSEQSNIDASKISRSEAILNMPTMPPMGAPTSKGGLTKAL
jgi:hypothetical protein